MKNNIFKRINERFGGCGVFIFIVFILEIIYFELLVFCALFNINIFNK